MALDALIRERRRFWLSAVRYYQCLRMVCIHPASELAYEQAKDDLLRVAERVKNKHPRELPPLPESFRYKCLACGILQETQGVCADCVADYGSEEEALKVAQKVPELFTLSFKRRPVRPLTQIVDEKALAARRELCGQVRRLLAKRGRVNLGAIATMFDVCDHTARAILRDVEVGSDGQPPVNVKKTRDGRTVYWEVSK